MPRKEYAPEIATKVERIKDVLRQNKDGIWLQELARRCGYSAGSVWYLLKYIENIEVVREIPEGERKMAYLKFIRLKA